MNGRKNSEEEWTKKKTTHNENNVKTFAFQKL
jgi:hypothetical protein